MNTIDQHKTQLICWPWCVRLYVAPPNVRVFYKTVDSVHFWFVLILVFLVLFVCFFRSQFYIGGVYQLRILYIKCIDNWENVTHFIQLNYIKWWKELDFFVELNYRIEAKERRQRIRQRKTDFLQFHINWPVQVFFFWYFSFDFFFNSFNYWVCVSVVLCVLLWFAVRLCSVFCRSGKWISVVNRLMKTINTCTHKNWSNNFDKKWNKNEK